MRRMTWMALILALVGCLFTTSLAHAHGEKHAQKKGILLVAFGTSVPEAETAMANIDRKVKAAFPDVEVRWAYTSKIIRHKLAKEEHRDVDSPAEALAKMMDQDFTDVAVQSLHTIPGEEYTGLMETAEAFTGMPKGMRHVAVGAPLLYTTKDVQRVVELLLAHIPAERKKNEAVILMGHGTPHPANIYYPGVQYYVAKKDPNVFIGTVEGSPELDDVLAELKARKITKAWLMPFMAVAGDHARNDLAGDEPDSWKSLLTKAGVTCSVVLKGTGEYDDVVDIWIEHLRRAMESLN